jgi:hypothetical protein
MKKTFILSGNTETCANYISKELGVKDLKLFIESKVSPIICGDNNKVETKKMNEIV